VATQVLTPTPQTPVGGKALPLLKLLAGPAAFVLALLLPLPLSYEGRVSLATFVCAIVWWITRPMPWGIAAMLPLVVFPAAGVMTIAATTQLYGQPIFFWIMGTVLVGYAIDKHGVARRVALAFLALPGIGGQMWRLAFAYMLVTGVISMFVSDAATIAMMCPIGMSLVRHIRTMVGTPTEEKTNFAAFITLGTFYAAVAGGTATVMGVPHNAIAVSLLERLGGRQLGFFEWMAAGVPVFLTLLVVFYLVLWVLTPPEIRQVPSGEAFLRAEHARLGPMRPNERRVLFVFAVMVALFTLPAFAAVALGDGHPTSAWLERALPVWVVPPLIMLLLFTIPVSDTPGGTLLSWKDAETQTPWNTMLLVVGGVAMTEALTQFGFVDLMGGVVKGLGIGATALPYVAALFVALTTDMISGIAATALYCSIFIPAAIEIGFNPASIAILIANVALGLIFPWAGAAAATTFAVGDIEMGRMIRIGVVATATFAGLTATVHLLLSPYI
jgi:solute carrier family 13 (sodium-dependent dicarboxylate transporter), member 2/3/5